MISVLLSLGVTVVFVVVVWFDDRRRGYKFSRFLDYMGSTHHWHSYGHMLSQFMITSFMMRCVPHWYAVIPTIVYVLIVELWLQRGWKNFWKNGDLWIDTFTYLCGMCAAVLLWR